MSAKSRLAIRLTVDEMVLSEPPWQ